MSASIVMIRLTSWREEWSSEQSRLPCGDAADGSGGDRGHRHRGSRRGRRRRHRGRPVVEVETDKAIAEVVAPRDGIVRRSRSKWATPSVGATLVVLAARWRRRGAPSAPSRASRQMSPVPSAWSSRRHARRPPAGGARSPGAPPQRARRSTLAEVTGTGPGGRITLGDVERAAARGRPTATRPRCRPSGARAARRDAQAIARRLTESQLVPQYTLTREIDASWLLAEKARLTAAGPRRWRLDLLVQALAEALARHPRLAASFVAGADGEPPRASAARRGSTSASPSPPTAACSCRCSAARTSARLPELAAERVAAGRGRPRAAGSALERDGRRGDRRSRASAPSASTASRRCSTRARARSSPSAARSRRSSRATAASPSSRPSRVDLHASTTASSTAPPAPRALAELADLLEGGMAWRTVSGAALVVGGASGIGRACAEALRARRLAGPSSPTSSARTTAARSALDVRDRDAVRAAVAQIAELARAARRRRLRRRHRPRHPDPRDRAARVGPGDRRQPHRRLQLPAGRPRPHITDGGSFTLISSVDSASPVAGLAHYCAAKAGVEALVALRRARARARAASAATRSLPGVVRTPLMAADARPPRRRPRRSSRRPRCAASPAGDEIADVVAFLASPAARWITGASHPGRRRHGPDRAPRAA